MGNPKSFSNSKRQFRSPLSFIEADSIVASTQQATTFAVCLLFEGIFSNLRRTGGTKSTSSVSVTVGGASFILASVTLLYSGLSVFIGISIGILVFNYMFVSYLKRFLNSNEGALGDFPGPRSWSSIFPII